MGQMIPRFRMVAYPFDTDQVGLTSAECARTSTFYSLILMDSEKYGIQHDTRS